MCVFIFIGGRSKKHHSGWKHDTAVLDHRTDSALSGRLFGTPGRVI